MSSSENDNCKPVLERISPLTSHKEVTHVIQILYPFGVLREFVEGMGHFFIIE
jgi:hypothetical protein